MDAKKKARLAQVTEETSSDRNRINISLPKEIHRTGKKMAAKDGFNFSSWLHQIIIKEAQRRGLKKAA